MGQEVLLVGSVPLKTAEEVMKTFGGKLGSFLPAMPDGEVGERKSWVVRLSYQVFNGHADLEVMRRPQPVNGVEQLMPRDRDDGWLFKVRDGVDRVRFGNPGYRLGYAKDAVNSHFVLKTMREKGILPPDMRLQISMPMVNSVVRPLFFPKAQDLPKIRPGYEEAIAAELTAIFDQLPAEDIAIQWDCAWEVAAVHEGIEGYPAEKEIETHTAPMGRLSKLIPDKARLGFHFCFGTYGGWPRFAPKDLGRAVELVNGSVKAIDRTVDWVHIPTLGNTDDAFYAPLSRLDVKGARVYLGLIHSMDSFKQRLDVARKYLPDFGVAAYCGFGRISPKEMDQTLKDHLEALRIAGLDKKH